MWQKRLSQSPVSLMNWCHMAWILSRNLPTQRVISSPAEPNLLEIWWMRSRRHSTIFLKVCPLNWSQSSCLCGAHCLFIFCIESTVVHAHFTKNNDKIVTSMCIIYYSLLFCKWIWYFPNFQYFIFIVKQYLYLSYSIQIFRSIQADTQRCFNVVLTLI